MENYSLLFVIVSVIILVLSLLNTNMRMSILLYFSTFFINRFLLLLINIYLVSEINECM